jgi:TfoX/Sxy family transcriptional regulator of competence genes
MAYNKDLDARVTALVAHWGTRRKKMFGGTCHLLKGNMVCGVLEDCLILRLGETAAAKAFKEPWVKPFDFTGRPMKGWVMVDQRGLQGENLERWLKKARSFVRTLPPK